MTYVKVTGEWTYLCRAVDQYGQVIDALLSAKRDLPAARRFFIRFILALRAGTVPAEVMGRAPAYPQVLDELVTSALPHQSTRPGPGREGLVHSLQRLLDLASGRWWR